MALSLRLIDRSRREKGLAHCLRNRWLNTSWTNGYGIAPKVLALPLATGVTIHEAFVPVLKYAQSTGKAPDFATTAQLIAPHLEAYRAKGTQRIIDFGVADDAQLKIQIAEQIALCAGLVMAWTQIVLPWVLSQSRIVEIETERVYVVGCTCGLSDGFGTAEQHDQRGCAGIGYMCRGDFYTMSAAQDSLTYHDFKSTGWLNEGWREGWRYKPQVAAGGAATAQHYGIPIGYTLIHGLYKGRRQGDYNPETKKYDLKDSSGSIIKRQNSPLVYAHVKEANPPMWAEQWSHEAPTGKGAKTEWKKRGVWEHPNNGIWGWLQQLPPAVLGAQTLLAGPFEVNKEVSKNYYESLVPDERRWQHIDLELHQILTSPPVNGRWEHPTYQSALNRLVPQSFDCYKYSKPCDMLEVCHKHAGWEDPLNNGYRLRRPHHEPELLQMRAAGLEPPPDVDEIQEENE